VVAYVWLSVEVPDAPLAGSKVLCFAMLAASAAGMVSNVRYFSGKTLKGAHWLGLVALGASCVVALAALAALGGLRVALPAAVCGSAWIYGMTGLVCDSVRAYRCTTARDAATLDSPFPTRHSKGR